MAYIAQSDEVVDRAAAAVGGLEEGESVTAVARTTPPTGNELFPGRLNLPIVQIVGIAASAERALELAGATSTAFGDVVVERQDAEAIPAEIRLTLDVINEPAVGVPDGSNPAIPIVVTFVAIFLLFLAAALIIEGVRARRRTKKDDATQTEAEQDDSDVFDLTPEQTFPTTTPEPELVTAPRRSRSSAQRRGSSVAIAGSTETVAVLEPGEDDSPARD